MFIQLLSSSESTRSEKKSRSWNLNKNKKKLCYTRRSDGRRNRILKIKLKNEIFEQWCGAKTVGEIILFYEIRILHRTVPAHHKLKLTVKRSGPWRRQRKIFNPNDFLLFWMWKYFYLNEFSMRALRLPPYTFNETTNLSFKIEINVEKGAGKCSVSAMDESKKKNKTKKVCRLFEEVIKSWVHFLK